MSSEATLDSGGGGTVEYIQHHLTNLCVGDCDPVTHQAAGFWAWHLDTIVISYLLGALIVFVGWRVGRSLNPNKPSGFQNFVEMLLDFTAGGIHSAQIGFQLTSDEGSELGGWNIDDVCIVAWEPPPDEEAGVGGAGGGGGAGGSGADPGLDPPGEGCACRTAPPQHDSGAPWALFGAATALLALVRRRK